jgi:hypothetical protein
MGAGPGAAAAPVDGAPADAAPAAAGDAAKPAVKRVRKAPTPGTGA